MAPILDFLTEFRNHDGSLLTNGEPVRRYIEERQDDELAEWDVLFASVGERGGDSLQTIHLEGRFDANAERCGQEKQ